MAICVRPGMALPIATAQNEPSQTQTTKQGEPNDGPRKKFLALGSHVLFA